MQVLKDAGAEGLQIGKIVQELQRRGLRTFEDMTKAKNSIGSSCGHEVAFARVSPGVFALRCLPGVVEVSCCSDLSGAALASGHKLCQHIQECLPCAACQAWWTTVGITAAKMQA